MKRTAGYFHEKAHNRIDGAIQSAMQPPRQGLFC